MRIAFVIHTAGQAFFWKNIMGELIARGHQIGVLSREKAVEPDFIAQSQVQCGTYKDGKKSAYGKLMQLPFQLITSYRFLSRFKPDVIAGASILEANTSAILRKPCIIFEDTEITPALERLQWQFTASQIVTPACFRKDLGKKQLRIEGFKELAYLHPNYFRPDPSILRELGVTSQEKYVIIRFNSFKAVHDIGLRGFSLEERYQAVRTLGKYARIFIAAEGRLPQDLEAYKLPIPTKRIHQAISYAQMLFGDSGTMSTEAAILGTPAIRCNSGLGDNELGNFIEMEHRYGLMYCILGVERGLQKAVELLQNPNLKEEWNQKRQKLLAETIDVTRFMVNLIEHQARR